MIIVCPKCGARNRIPDVSEPSETYRCGKCKWRLTPTPKARDTSGERADGIDYVEHIQVRELAASEPLLETVRHWLKERENKLILLLVLLTLLLHFFVIPYWDTPIVDEEHYVPEARSIIHEGEIMRPEHPSLGKLFIASGIFVFGDNSWGWRLPSAIFAAASIVLFYFICRRLLGVSAALLASILLALESLTFVHSGLAVLDVFSLTFMLLAFLFYLQGRYVFSGVSLALSALCKMTGLLGGLAILAHWFITRRRDSPRTIGLFLVSAFVAFMLLMPLSDFAATRQWLNPIDRVWLMVSGHETLTLGSLPPEELVHISYPWEWVLSPTGYFPLSPASHAIMSTTVWILIIPAMGYMVYEYTKNKTDASLFALLWFGATYLLWIPLSLGADRVTYFFYFYPSVGAICMAIGFGIRRLWEVSSRRRFTRYRQPIQATIVGYLIVHALFFLFSTRVLRMLLSGPQT